MTMHFSVVASFEIKSYGSARSASIEASSATSFGDFPALLATCIGAPRSNSTETSEPKPLLAATCSGVLLSLSPRPTSDPFLNTRVGVQGSSILRRGMETTIASLNDNRVAASAAYKNRLVLLEH